jgi:hypothetical protein
MKFLKINEDKYIRIDNVEALEVIDQLRTRVYMQSGNVYESINPCENLIMLLDVEEEKPEIAQNAAILKKLNVLVSSATNFVG